MPPKSLPKGRKYDCGYVKRKKKIRLEKLTQSQSGAIEKFIIKEPQNVENIDADIVDVQTVDIENAENVNNNIDVENVVDDNESVDVENENVDDDNEIVRAENVDVNDIGHDIFDPTIWDSLDSRMRDLYKHHISSEWSSEDVNSEVHKRSEDVGLQKIQPSEDEVFRTSCLSTNFINL
ncbi:unnamed protein product [Trifolium pratense]|uniref:Uncharacterized protein n=1 Tax=Trifolium pratense TaxID=57577 RepID=A0ACB0LVA7_TRIPR|nr:unnamed protein product [Trifolium pratense]